MIEVTDTAIQKLIEKKVGFIRLGVKGGGCAGYEYFLEDTTNYINMSDKLQNYGNGLEHYIHIWITLDGFSREKRDPKVITQLMGCD